MFKETCSKQSSKVKFKSTMTKWIVKTNTLHNTKHAKQQDVIFIHLELTFYLNLLIFVIILFIKQISIKMLSNRLRSINDSN